MQLTAGSRVRCHKNLQNGQWSITVSGKVVGYVSEIVLTGVSCKYWAGGYDRIQESARAGKPRRRVCAWMEGTIAAAVPSGAETPISYNPYKSSRFYRRDNGAEVTYCAAVHFTSSRGAVAIGEVR